MGREPEKNVVDGPEMSKSTDVGDDKRNAKLIVCAHHSQIDAPVFHREPATSAIVVQHHELVLQRGVQDVVADSGGDIEALAGKPAVANDCANLVGGRLDNRVALQTEVRHRPVKLPVTLD